MTERGSVDPADERFARETAGMIARRLPFGGITFLGVIALAALVEVGGHPERGGTYWTIFALEAAAWVVATLVVWSFPSRCVITTTALTIALVALITTYHVVVRGQLETVVLALGYLVVGSMVLFPWGGRGQLPLAVAALLAYGAAVLFGVPRATPVGLNLLGLGTIAALTVGSAVVLEHRRLTLFRQTTELRTANTALAEANRAKTQFLASVSHELRTPLDAILGYLQLVEEGTFGGAPPAALEEPLDRMSANAQILMRLINDFLDLSRLEANRLTLHMEPVEVASVAAEAAELVDGQVRGRPIELLRHVPNGVQVFADRDRLRQVLVNLLSNAIKFTERGRIEVELREEGDGGAVIEVRDSGIGIPVEEQEVIFEPFRRGARAARVGGVGIGLALSRQLTEAMGGTMRLESKVGRGSTFSLHLRREPERAT